MIAVSPFEIEIILDIIKKHVPQCDVLAFGSRYKWTNEETSDLDLAVMGEDKVGFKIIGNMKEDFMESDLPFRVDVLDYHAVSDSFRKIIDEGNERIYRGKSRRRLSIKLSDAIIFNPAERLSKGAVAKKVSMDKLQPFVRDISAWEIKPYGGGAKFRNGDTIMARITPCLENGKTAFTSFLDEHEVGYGSTEFIVWRAKEGVTDSKYIYYLSQSPEIRDIAIKSMVGSSGRQRVQQSVLNNHVIDLPDLPTQRAIAATLSALDDKIANNTKMNHHLEQMAQAIFKSWFEDFEPWGGVMPYDWRDGTLSEIATITMGQSPDGSSYNEDGIGTVFYQGRAEFGSRFPTRRMFTTQPKRMAAKGNALMSVRAPVGDLNVAYEFCCLGRGLAGIQGNNGCQSFILYTMFALKQYLDMFNGEGTVFGSINKNDLASLPVLIPSDAVVHQFEELVSPMDANIEANYAESCNLQVARDTLLPRLMSGEQSVADLSDVKC